MKMVDTQSQKANEDTNEGLKGAPRSGGGLIGKVIDT